MMFRKFEYHKTFILKKPLKKFKILIEYTRINNEENNPYQETLSIFGDTNFTLQCVTKREGYNIVHHFFPIFFYIQLCYIKFLHVSIRLKSL